MMDVVVPDGSVSGQTLLVQTTDQQVVQVVIPAGLKAGDTFSIASVAADASSKASAAEQGGRASVVDASSKTSAAEQGGRASVAEQKLTLQFEELQEIKAHTMHKMLETLDTSADGLVRLLYLTGDQADLIANKPSSLQKMLSVLIDEDAPTPQVLISLLRSGGFREYTQSQSKKTVDYFAAKNMAGVKHGKPPFLSREEEDEATLRLDRFMADVLIPLAAQNHAIVLCEATPVDCALSSSFTRMLSMADAKWQGRRPFTVISATNQLAFLYQNNGKKPYWKEVRAASTTWTRRDADLRKKLEQQRKLDECEHDLDDNATCLLIVEPVPSSLPYSRLMNELERHLCAQMPSLAIKTGFTRKNKFGSHSADTLSYAADVTLSGVPLLALDLRRRPKLHSRWRASGVLDRLGDVRRISEVAPPAPPAANDEGEAADGDWMPPANALPAPATPATPATPPTTATPTLTPTRQRSSGPPSFGKSHTHQIFDSSLMSRTWDLRAARAEQQQQQQQPSSSSSSLASRQQAIDLAKEVYGRSADDLLSRGLADTFDVCTLAFFHEALFGDGSPRSGSLEEQEHVPLFLAIAHAYHLQDEGGVAVEDIIKGGAGGASMYNGHRGLAAASSSQVAEVALWVTKRYFRDAWAVLSPERKEALKQKMDADALEECEQHDAVYREVWRDDLPAMLAASRTLLSSPNFYHLNLLDSTSEQARKQVLRLVQLDRLPRANPLVGLLLLRDAWKDYDVAVEMAGRYKHWCKRLFLLQLTLSWLVVVASTFGRVGQEVGVEEGEVAALHTEEEIVAAASATAFTNNVVFVLRPAGDVCWRRRCDAQRQGTLAPPAPLHRHARNHHMEV